MESGSVRTAVANRAVRYCERCGAASPRGAGYCASCGVALPPLHEEVVHSSAGSVPNLEDQARGDGQAAWDELSVAAQQHIAQQGGSAISLTQELQRSPLPPILQITFAGGSTMIDGREAAVFIVTANVADTQRQVPYYFHQYQGPD
jgi:hypothetical protein